MRELLNAEQLLDSAPAQIWPGFMLPDTLPLIGNAYGDWLCVQVDHQNQLGELLYWYHGGGDWIPVGFNLAEALLHDAVDQFRSLRKQMIRGASESRLGASQQQEALETIARLEAPKLREWLQAGLTSSEATSAWAAQALERTVEFLRQGEYTAAVKQMSNSGWAKDATACDLIEECLQGPLLAISQPELAEAAGMQWFPDFVQFLFDPEAAPAEVQKAVQTSSGLTLDAWPRQDWGAAKQVAQSVLERRADLGWAYAIVGYHHERQGEFEAAALVYRRGRFASSFAEQSVRFNSHCMSDRTGKFSMDRLQEIQEYLKTEHRTDAYLNLFLQPQNRSVLDAAHGYWWELGEGFRKAADFGRAYDCFYRSGWDLGVSRLTEYRKILEALADSAESAGWHARARVAETHLSCLNKRMLS